MSSSVAFGVALGQADRVTLGVAAAGSVNEPRINPHPRVFNNLLTPLLNASYCWT